MITKKKKTKKKTVKKSEKAPDMPKRMLEQYMPLVNAIASMVSGKGLPPSIDFNDLVSDGVIGLMKAWDNFDPTRGVKFETYASYRIRGEILDGLKNYNPVPYRVQVMIRDMAKKGYQEVAKEKAELTDKKNLTEQEFKDAVKRIRKVVSASALMYLLSIEQIAERSEVNVSGGSTPAQELEFSELKTRLDNGVEDLPEIEKQVVKAFFRGEQSQKDIAEELKLSRSKVNRIIAKAITKLRDKLKS